MININLLPWRAQLQKHRQRDFIVLLCISIAFCIFICLIMHAYLANQLSRQVKANTYLQEQITVLDQEIIQINIIKTQKNDLIRRLFIIHKLQSSRVLLVEMFNNFINVLPAGIYITSIKKDANSIIFEGKARSNQEVSQLMKNIETSSSFKTPVLTEIQDQNADTNPDNVIDKMYALRFELKMQQEALDEKTDKDSFSTPAVPAPIPEKTS